MSDPPLDDLDWSSGEEELGGLELSFPEAGSVSCWRCGKPFSRKLSQCPLCLANNQEYRGSEPLEPVQTVSAQSPAIVRVVWVFVAMALVSLAVAFCVGMTIDLQVPLADQSEKLLGWTIVAEVVDTFIVIWALFSIPVVPVPQPERGRALACLSSLPLLVAILGINWAYHLAIRSISGVKLEENPLFSGNLLVLQLMAICLQPAIVEELFFRNLAMGAALELVSAPWAVFLTATLFALAHLGQPLGMPVLWLMGLALGYLRLSTGTLWLPMLFHFLHNLAVLIVERMQ